MSKDVTNSSISMSEGEGDGDLEGIVGRVAELKEMLHGKERVVEALHAEIDQLRGEPSSPTSSQSHNSSVQYRDVIGTYHLKLQEFERALNQRDNLIEDLTTSLQQALASRDALLAQINTLNSINDTSTKESPDKKLSNLLSSLNTQKALVANLQLDLAKERAQVKQLENEKFTQATEIRDYEQQIDNFNKQIQTLSPDKDSDNKILEIQKQYEIRVEKIKKDMKLIQDKFVAEVNTNLTMHERERKELMAKHETEILRLKDENQQLESQYSKEISALQSNLHTYKSTIEELKKKITISTDAYAKEKDLLQEQIQLHKVQLEDITSKYLSTTSILDSKESIEKSLEQALNNATSLKIENDSLKFKLDDLTSRYNAAQNLIDYNQATERSLSSKVYSLEKNMSRLSGLSISEFDATQYRSFDEVALQHQIVQQKLEERAALENELLEKIKNLETTASQTMFELEQANLAKESYEKQIKDMKNLCDRLKSEMKMNHRDIESPTQPDYELQQEIINLKQKIDDQNHKNIEYIKEIKELNSTIFNLRSESEKLKEGLKLAWNQCAEFEEKLDQTLAFNESNVNEISSYLEQLNYDSSQNSDTSHYEAILRKLEICQKQLKELTNENVQLKNLVENKEYEHKKLLLEFENFKSENEEDKEKMRKIILNYEKEIKSIEDVKRELEEKHTEETTKLKTYFERKWLQVAKEYSEEIYSQQSKKLSDNDSEIEELTDDLYVGTTGIDSIGAGGDSLDISSKLIDEDSKSLTNGNSTNHSDSRVKMFVSEYEEKLNHLQLQTLQTKEKNSENKTPHGINKSIQTEKTVFDFENSVPIIIPTNTNNYNENLNDQVDSIRADIIKNLQEKFESLLKLDKDPDEWPEELLQLRDKFLEKSKNEMETMKNLHSEELKMLKEEYNQIIESYKFNSEEQRSFQNNLVKERNALHKTCITLKSLVEQLIDYFDECEEEVNETIFSELIKKQWTSESKENDNCNNYRKMKENYNKQICKVHFAPRLNEFLSYVRPDSDLSDLINYDRDISQILKNDIDTRRKQWKSESAKYLGTSESIIESWSYAASESSQENDKVNEPGKIITILQNENKHLQFKIMELQEKLLIIKNGKSFAKEDFRDQNITEDLVGNFSELQDKAKYVVVNGSDDTSYLLQLIEELCKHADKSFEEIRKEKEDLEHQIDAADKQLRSTRKFQEEQAVEREAERDEATRRIQFLEEQLKEKERLEDKMNRINTDESTLSPAHNPAGNIMLQSTETSDLSVDDLNLQVKELLTKNTDISSELKDAIEKIWDLREIISDLEKQLQIKSEKEEDLQNHIKHLEEAIHAQTINQQELAQELENMKNGAENHNFTVHIDNLQEELRKHQLSSEQLNVNSSALKQIKTELKDLLNQLDKKTKELETLHLLGSSLSLSQPSEDVSIRDQIDAVRSPTPDDPNSPLILPLNNILHLKENLLKHFRAEDVALKRIKDLDMQLSSERKINEELSAERDLLQQKTSEQLFEIEKLRGKLEQLKQNEPFAQKQATSKLETQLFELNNKLKIFERMNTDKNVEINDLKNQLERKNRMLQEKDNEISDVLRNENSVIEKLKHELNVMLEDKRIMKTKLEGHEKSKQDLPALIDGILADKNDEIDLLKGKIEKLEKNLEIYLALNLDESQLKELLKHSEQKNSARTLSDVLSINSEYEENIEAIREAQYSSKCQNDSNFKFPHSTLINSKREVEFSPNIPEILEVPLLDLGSCSSQHSTEAHTLIKNKSIEPQSLPSADNSTVLEEENNVFICPRHGKTNSKDDSTGSSETSLRIHELEMKIYETKDELDAKMLALQQKEQELNSMQEHLDFLQETIKLLDEEKTFLKQKFEVSSSNEQKIKRDLEETENKLKLQKEETAIYRDKIYVNEKILVEESQKSKNLESSLSKALEENECLKNSIQEKDKVIHNLINESKLDHQNYQLYKRKYEELEKDLLKYQEDIEKLSQALNRREQIIRNLEEIAMRNSYSSDSTICDKDQEISHLQEYLKEKDKVIRQMSDDSKSLQKALEKIQSKMKESGNIVELRRKLKEERKLNLELQREIENINKCRRSSKIIDDNRIEEKVQEELNISAKLDQQLLNAIDSEPDGVTNNFEDLKVARKEIDHLIKYKKELEIDNEMLKSLNYEFENKIAHMKVEFENDSKKLLNLQEELFQKRHIIKCLQLEIQKERNLAEENKKRDTELIAQLRHKLNESLEMKEKLIDDIKILNEECTKLKAIALRPDHYVKENEQEFENKSQKLSLIIERLEKDQQKNREYEKQSTQFASEKASYEKQLEVVQEENEKLHNGLILAEGEKENLKIQISQLKEKLKTITQDLEWNQSILRTMSDTEIKRVPEDHTELKNLRRELINAQRDILDKNAKIRTLKEQCERLTKRENQLSCKIECMIDEDSELKLALSTLQDEKRKLKNIMNVQSSELESYKKRELEWLEYKTIFSDFNYSPTKILQKIKVLSSTNDKYLQTIKSLESQLAQKVNQRVFSQSDFIEKIQYFYGKFLRADSRRKSLTYQKHYLLTILIGYQRVEENISVFLSQLTQQQKKYVYRSSRRKNPRWRFRSIVFMTISICRMKWLVDRWSDGVRAGCKAILARNENYTASSQPATTYNHSPPIRDKNGCFDVRDNSDNRKS